MKGDVANVWHGGRRVGRLRRRLTRRIESRYTHEWVRERRLTISQLIPLGPGDLTVPDERAHRFLVTLLPEGVRRERALRHFHVPEFSPEVPPRSTPQSAITPQSDAGRYRCLPWIAWSCGKILQVTRRFKQVHPPRILPTHRLPQPDHPGCARLRSDLRVHDP